MDGTSRRDLLHELQELIFSAETSQETATRLAFYPLQASAARIGHDLKVFEALRSSEPKSLEQLQDMTNAHPITLGRLLRYMASVGLIRETGINQFEANQTCQKLATPEAVTTLTHFFDNGGPLFQEMPAFLRKTNYQDVIDEKATVLQSAFKTDLDTYAWFSQHPALLGSLVKYMALEQQVRARWLDEYPVERDAQNWDPNLPVFVDVGGNVGHYCALFKHRFPAVPGRVILQDLPHSLAQALQTPGVEAVAHDFFEPQPLKGARFYHLGWILHNWSDEKAKHILRQIRSAMGDQSMLLINDMILPETEVPAFAAALDLVMLGGCGGRERTMKEWRELLGDVGLVIRECIMYDRELCHGIIGVALS
ncbi:MAG: hypothetical protein Q9165_007179 [Trypethelium subeluteriae]